MACTFKPEAPIGPLDPVAEFGHPAGQAIWLGVDGVEKQRSDLSHLMWAVPETVANLSTYFTLRPGDLIYGGAPEGVGRIERGRTLVGGTDGLCEITMRFVR